MKKHQYQAQQLKAILEDLQSKNTSGTLYLDARINHRQKRKSGVLVWKNGEITFAGSGIPQAEVFVGSLGKRFNPSIANVAIKFAIERATNPTSIRCLLEPLARVRVLTWHQIETFVKTQVVQMLEQLLPHPGSWQLDSTNQFDICYGEDGHGFALSQLLQEVTNRQQEWENLAFRIPDMEAVPLLTENALKEITDQTGHQNLLESVDGKRSLVEIAQKLDRDPLELARSYLVYAELGWIIFEGTTAQTQAVERSNILAVDDSPIIQIMLIRALSSHYHVLTASNAMDAMKLLYSRPISLMILDVTMPEIDGLELCRAVRSIPKFRNLPIIMLTARDGLTDKLKGKFAGSNQYLTKPFTPEKLMEIVEEYV
jgi:CheY-like chemotaxis protein